MLSECCCVSPCFTDEKDARTRCALEHVVCNAALVALRSGHKGFCSLKGLSVLALVGLEETVKSDHGLMYLEMKGGSPAEANIGKPLGVDLEHIGNLHLESVGLVLEFAVGGRTFVVAKYLSRTAEGEIVAQSHFEMTEEAYARADVPSGVHV